MDECLETILAEASSEYDAWLPALEVMPDHIHLLIEVDPQFGVHLLVKHLKGCSSQLLGEEYPHLKRRLPTLWTNAYFVATTGGAPLAMINRYVEQQKRV